MSVITWSWIMDIRAIGIQSLMSEVIESLIVSQLLSEIIEVSQRSGFARSGVEWQSVLTRSSTHPITYKTKKSASNPGKTKIFTTVANSPHFGA